MIRSPAWFEAWHARGMLRDADYFGDRELPLVYIAKKLKEALALEALLTENGVDYLIEADKYHGGLIFRSERVGAFFYIEPEHETKARELMAANGYRAFRPDLS